METAAASTEIWILGWSAVLLIVQVCLQATSSYDLGPKYLLGPRDEKRVSRNVLAGRLKRALRNLLETYPAFIAIVVALVVTGKTGGIAATGAVIWLVARVVFVAVYAAGIPLLRTLVWLVSTAGLVLMLIRLLF
ncbi:MAPEG family protein [Mesorhizobium sp. VNQ89]|uniref:MAPEG family protein n=1 Tax=Mesorhizobium quangtriensis TaxID=3157709 RepID=UPI0032B81862